MWIGWMACGVAMKAQRHTFDDRQKMREAEGDVLDCRTEVRDKFKEHMNWLWMVNAGFSWTTPWLACSGSSVFLKFSWLEQWWPPGGQG